MEDNSPIRPEPRADSPPPRGPLVPDLSASRSHQTDSSSSGLNFSSIDEARASSPSDKIHSESARNALPSNGKSESRVLEEVSEQISAETEQENDSPEHVETKKPNIIKRFFKFWFGSPKKRWAIFLTLLIAGLAIGFNPSSRYALMNYFGVRSSMAIKITDRGSLQPLEGVKVELGNKSTRTNKQGFASFEELRQGPTNLQIRKLGFATEKFPVVIGWGSNPQDDVALSPTGLSFVFQVKDFLSNKGISSATATSGNFTAQADDDGEIILTLANPANTVGVKIEANGYQPKQIKISTDDQENRTIKMKPTGKHVFISNRTGSYDLYEVQADGSNEELLVKASPSAGLSSTSLAVHPSKNAVAMATSRGRLGGDESQILHVVNQDNGQDNEVVRAKSIRIIGWHASRVAFIYEDSDQKPDSTERFKLSSYDYKTKSTSEVANANGFNDAVVIKDKLYYAPSAQNQNGINVSLFEATLDGSTSDIVLAEHVLELIRLSYDGLIIRANDDEGTSTDGLWYGYNTLKKISPKKRQAPPTTRSRGYIDAPGSAKTAYVEQRDGLGTLVIEDTKTHKEQILLKKEGLMSPIKWLNKTTLVYHMDTEQETADYVISLDGGEPRKITDVTSVNTNNLR